MRNALAVVAAFCVGSALVGCNSNSTPAPASGKPQPAPEPQQTIGWTLTLKSDCGAEAGNCIGGYGFTLLSDGHYQVGPGPNGEVKNGTISPEDQSKINALASSFENGNLRSEGHEEFVAVDSADTVTMTQGASGSGLVTLLKTDGANMTFLTDSFDSAKSLLSTLKEIAAKYYTLPFPDTCAESTASIAKLFSTLQSCTVDADCGYFDSAYEVLDPKSNEFVTTDDCSVVKPLAFGNVNAVKTNMAKIGEALESVRTSCGDSIFRSDCTGVTGYQITGLPAVCKQGVCQAPSATSFR